MTGLDAQSVPADPAPTLDEVQAAIGRLPAFEREVFLAQRADGFGFAEIAARHGISVKRVEKLLARSLGRIRRHIDPSTQAPKVTDALHGPARRQAVHPCPDC